MYGRLIRILAIAGFFASAYAADTRTVQIEFDRCAQAMERVERSLRRYDDEIRSLKRGEDNIDKENRETYRKETAALETRLEYFRNRYERATGQADKIRDELKNISGPTCPSCVESSVKLYCRNAESLQADVEQYLVKASDLRSRSAMRLAAPERGDLFIGRHTELDSIFRAFAEEKMACNDNAATTLLQQARVNLTRADSLHAAGDDAQAVKSLDIAGSLLEKAAQRCAKK